MWKFKSSKYQKNSCGFEIAKSFAKSKDGFCLSTEYINANKPMLWKCSNSSHKEWYAPYSSVINKGLWCRDCGNIKAAESNKNPYGLETANSFAKLKMGIVYLLNTKELEKKWFGNVQPVIIKNGLHHIQKL